MQIINYTVSNLQLLTSVEVNMHFYRPKTIFTDLHKAEINMVSLHSHPGEQGSRSDQSIFFFLMHPLFYGSIIET